MFTDGGLKRGRNDGDCESQNCFYFSLSRMESVDFRARNYCLVTAIKLTHSSQSWIISLLEVITRDCKSFAAR